MKFTNIFEQTLDNIKKGHELEVVALEEIEEINYALDAILKKDVPDAENRALGMIYRCTGKWGKEAEKLELILEKGDKDTDVEKISRQLKFIQSHLENLYRLNDLIRRRKYRRNREGLDELGNTLVKKLNPREHKKRLKEKKKLRKHRKRKQQLRREDQRSMFFEELELMQKDFDTVRNEEYILIIEAKWREKQDLFDSGILIESIAVLSRLGLRAIPLLTELSEHYSEKLGQEGYTTRDLNSIGKIFQILQAHNLVIPEKISDTLIEKFVHLNSMDKYRVLINYKSIERVLRYLYNSEHYEKIINFPELENFLDRELYLIRYWKAEALRKKKDYDRCIEQCNQIKPEGYTNLQSDQIRLLLCLAYANFYNNRKEAVEILKSLREIYGQDRYFYPRILCGLVYLGEIKDGEKEQVNELLQTALKKSRYMKKDLEDALRILYLD